MTELLPIGLFPPYAAHRANSFKGFGSFLRDSKFPDIATWPAFAAGQEPVAAYEAAGSRDGLATWIAGQITALHTSAAFDRHAAEIAAKGAKHRTPRLRNLVPPLPAAEERSAELQQALADALASVPAERVDIVLHQFLGAHLFPEAIGDQPLSAWLEDFFHAQRAAALAALVHLDTPGGIGPERQLLLDIAIRHYLQARYFERAHDLLSRAAATSDPGRDVDPRYMEDLWYSAFRLGRIAEARDWLLQWACMRPLQKRPLVNRAIVAAYDDKAEACLLLERAGAQTGQSTVPGNVLYAEYSLQRGAIQPAELCIRRACEIAQAASRPVPPEYLIALHNILARRGERSNILHEFFGRSNLSLGWDLFGIDTVSDHTADPDAPEARVAVVMTAFNAAPHLPRAIEGVLGQSVSGVRLIMVDDSSDDETAAVCMPYVDSGALTYLRTECNLGTYAAKNLGIRHALEAGCDYVALCDSDDFWLRTHVAQHLREMAGRPEIKCSTSQWLRVREDGTIECGLLGRYVESCPHSTFFTADVFERLGFFDPVRFGADREFQQRVRLHFGRRSSLSINAILTLGRRHELSLTQSGAGAITEFSESPHRFAYWKAWNEWHDAELAAGRLPVLDGTLDNRPFPVPDDMQP